MVIVAVVLVMATGMGYTRRSRHVSTEWCFTLTVPSKKPHFERKHMDHPLAPVQISGSSSH